MMGAPIFRIGDDGGRIGHFWWANSDLIPMDVEDIFLISLLAVRWGSWGFGYDMTLTYEPVDRRKPQ